MRTAEPASSTAGSSTERQNSEASEGVDLSNSREEAPANSSPKRHTVARKGYTRQPMRPTRGHKSNTTSPSRSSRGQKSATKSLQLPIREPSAIIAQLSSFLETSPTSKALEAYLSRRLHEQQIHMVESPHHFYHELIQSLIEHKYHREALFLYKQMVTKHNFIPLPQTQAQALALSLAYSCKTDQDITQALASVVQDREYTENDFMNLLDTLGELNVPLSHIVRVAEQFVKARGDAFVPSRILKAKLVKTQVSAGNIEAAVDIGIRLKKAERRMKTPKQAYVEVLKLFAQINPHDADGIPRVLKIMQERGFSPDIHVFNAMLSRELMSRSLRGTFRTYRTIISIYKEQLADLTPNEETFRLLFDAIIKFFKGPIFVQEIARRQVMPPRAVYRDLLYFQKLGGVEITSRLLTKALEAFMAQRDYAGAHVILKSFFLFKIPITIDQYHVVVRHIIRRLRFEIKSMRYRGEIRWADRFLDIQDQQTLAQVQKLAIDKHEATKILRAAGAKEFKLDGYLLRPIQPEPKYQMPTAGMVAGIEPAPDDLKLSDAPLLRLVRRSIKATMDLVALEDPKAASKNTLSDIVLQAKLDMRTRLRNKHEWRWISMENRWPKDGGPETEEEDNPT